MNYVNQLLRTAKEARRGLLKIWAEVCQDFFEEVRGSYWNLVEKNIRTMGPATMDLLERGGTKDSRMNEAQYPKLKEDKCENPVMQALYEVGAIQRLPSGDLIVEPTPAVLLRGLARLALPPKYLRGIVNAVRSRRGEPTLSQEEFSTLDKELFEAVRQGLKREFEGQWFRMLNRGVRILDRATILPCIRLAGSQEFYEEGINFYRGQGADAEVFIYSTTSGLVIPREFGGDSSKNYYRYKYFTQGILGRTSCVRVYQWERYHTARGLALEYEAIGDEKSRAAFKKNAYATLRHFARADNLAIYEVQQFDTWKTWCTLVGPQRQQFSIRSGRGNGAIGHGVAYDAGAIKKRSDLFARAATVLGSLRTGADVFGEIGFMRECGPAITVAAICCGLLGFGIERLGSLLDEPILRRCRKDRESAETKPIKLQGCTLSESRVVEIVDGLLDYGIKILASERQAKPTGAAPGS